ncbi:MAG TPA: MBOAT family O-acyltransferase [Anaerolineae bacterium]|nr:MBOAT family O-acyltransferase [Anaerolineae bacterium]
MLFNSLEFLLFLPTIFFLYWFIYNRSIFVQNALLLGASCLFYAWWDRRFLILIFISAFVDYIIGWQLGQTTNKTSRRLYLTLSLSVNLGLLGIFKYYNFFVDSLMLSFETVGIPVNIHSLNVILPVGISFYTFQTLSYSIDIFRQKLQPTKSITSFFAFVSFFPQLVAGPIERASSLLPQFERPRTFDPHQAREGMQFFLWGLFKKVVIADTLAVQVDYIFENYTTLDSFTLFLGAIFFAFQIYGDFSGYSDIAIGVAKLFGFELMQNFATPYFSRNIGEFWRRWHISLSTWFRDYVYIPLGGNRHGTALYIRNILLTFVISGLWHGANWTFILWGFLHGLYYLPLMYWQKSKQNKVSEPTTAIVAQGKLWPTSLELRQMGLTFLFVTIAWVFFRAENIGHAITYWQRLFSWHLWAPPTGQWFPYLFLILLFVAFEWIQRERENPLALTQETPTWIRWSTYMIAALLCATFWGTPVDFVYFQF